MKRLMAVLFSFAFAFSGITGLYVNVNAAGNVKNKNYSFYNNGNAVGYTSGEKKLNSTKVYIHPISGPALEYTVQGKNSSGWHNRSSSHVIYNGTEASFTNGVFENKEKYARLRLERTNRVPVSTNGKWSPDSTRNYTIYY